MLQDRVDAANDNAEHLFRHLRSERPEINAWFVLKRGTPDWNRLSGAGHGDRLVPYGSLRWRALLACASQHISSHAQSAHAWRSDDCVVTNLRHGVTQGDVSRYLSTSTCDLLVTTTPRECDYLASISETTGVRPDALRLTGLPRFDRLVRIGSRLAIADRRLILIAPTWRYYVAVTDRGRRAGEATGFEQSEYANHWGELLRSPTLARLAAAHGLEIVYLPHPRAEYGTATLHLPPHVIVAAYGSSDIQELLVRSRVVITDYSSLAFDAAVAGRPVVYHQFDKETFMTPGNHTVHPTYFDHGRDGFGLIAYTEAEVENEVQRLVAQSVGGQEPLYAARARELAAVADGHCCERVTQAIEGIRMARNDATHRSRV